MTFTAVQKSLPMNSTSHVMSLNDMLHPALHSLATKSRLWLARLGKICPNLAAAGSCVRARLHSCVERTLVPSGRVTIMGLTAGIFLGTGAVVMM